MGNNRKKQRRDEVLLQMVIQRIKQLRELHHHSQADLNAATDVDVANLETGSNFPNLTTLVVICQFYNITLDEFFAPMKYPQRKDK